MQHLVHHRAEVGDLHLPTRFPRQRVGANDLADARAVAEIYTSSPRPYRGLPELAYPFHDTSIQFTCCGRICLHRKKINLRTVFAGQAVGLKEVEEGIWLVSFMDYDLGYVDLEERTLQPLDNPFGPKVM